MMLNVFATTVPRFAPADWIVLGGYLALVVVIGLLASRRRRDGTDFFLAGRTMPMWAVAISILATAQSAATFVGGPEDSYRGDLTYLATNLGPMIAAVIVAVFFIPAFYRHNVTSVYELIGHEMGTAAQRVASGAFMLGRVFASGARLYIVSIPFALVAFGDIEPRHLVLSILIVTIVATAYSMAGGIRAVIWTDVMQVLVYVTCIGLALLLIWQKIPAGAGELMHALRTDEAGNKLVLLDFSFNISSPFTVWSVIFGMTLLMIAAYGADQDLTQRMLTCRSPRRASWSVITATLLGIPIVFIFLAMGLLLYVYFERPDVMGAAAPDYAIDDTKRVFIEFIIREMPVGVRGLMLAGLFAAAMSSLDSSLNAMSSTTVADFYRPWKRLENRNFVPGGVIERRVGRAASIFWAIMLGGFACICIAWQEETGETLIRFALHVMTFAYSGLLGIFFVAIFTKRGNALSAVAAMATGFTLVLIMNPLVWPRLTGWIDGMPQPAFTWQLVFAAGASAIICAIPKRKAPGKTTE